MSPDLPAISIVVIGRNEGARLVRCIESVCATDYPSQKIEIIYVDTNSTDGSCEAAKQLGATVIRIQPQHPTAACARNAGLRVAHYELIHFLDGDTVLNKTWLKKAVAAIQQPDVAAVYGRREEMDPHATIYHFWMHHDWYVPPGRVDTCGGDVLFRREVLQKAGGYDETLIAGEERDLCTRLIRDQGIVILRLDEPMTLHDIHMSRFGQYWKRCLRSGFAYAQVATRHPGLRRWRRTCRHNMIHTFVLFAAVTMSLILWTVLPVAAWMFLLAVAVARDTFRCRGQVGSSGGALLYAMHHYLSKLPTVVGHLAYYHRHLRGETDKSLIK